MGGFWRINEDNKVLEHTNLRGFERFKATQEIKMSINFQIPRLNILNETDTCGVDGINIDEFCGVYRVCRVEFFWVQLVILNDIILIFVFLLARGCTVIN